jgi:hypothetical protein
MFGLEGWFCLFRKDGFSLVWQDGFSLVWQYGFSLVWQAGFTSSVAEAEIGKPPDIA